MRDKYCFWWHIPRFVHHDVLLAQEALLHHPLVAQELGPSSNKRKNVQQDEPTPVCHKAAQSARAFLEVAFCYKLESEIWA